MVGGVELLPHLADAGFEVVHPFDAAAAAALPGLAPLAGAARLGVLVGHGRALWPVFQAALAAEPALAAQADPLDRYTERVLDRAAAAAGGRALYGHRTYGGAYLPLQRLAVATGLGALGPGQLVVHPTLGPWFALRGVLLLDGEPPARAPIPLPCRCDGRCAALLARAQAGRSWRDWLAVRDACTLSASRYSEDQIAFHYRLLRESLEPVG